MTFTYGYQMESTNGSTSHLVVPPMLSKKITLATGGNTGRWQFYGTRKEILDWMRDHKDIELEMDFSLQHQHQRQGVGNRTASTHTRNSYYNYYKSFFVSDYIVERVKVEIRPRIESKDNMIESLCRTIVASGSRLGDVVDDLETQWNGPAKSYYQQTVDVFTDAPPPTHVLSADPPASIHINSNGQ